MLFKKNKIKINTQANNSSSLTEGEIAINPDTGELAVGTTSSGNITIGTSASGGLSFAYGSGSYAEGSYTYNNYVQDAKGFLLEAIIPYLTETQLRAALLTLFADDSNFSSGYREASSYKSDIVELVFSSRHLSEDFICEFFNYLDLEEFKKISYNPRTVKSLLYKYHKAEIENQEYSRVALLLEMVE